MIVKVADVKLFVLFNRYFGTSFKEFKELTDEDKCFLNECVDEVIEDEEDLIDEEVELVLSEDDKEFLKGIVKPVNINVGYAVRDNVDVGNIADRIKEILEEQIGLSGKGAI